MFGDQASGVLGFLSNRTQWRPYWESQNFVFGSSAVLFELVQVHIHPWAVTTGSDSRCPPLPSRR